MAKILIVDDSKTSRKFLRNMLEDAGHEVVSEAVYGVEGAGKVQNIQTGYNNYGHYNAGSWRNRCS